MAGHEAAAAAQPQVDLHGLLHLPEFQRLTPEQLRVVTEGDGPLLVVAGPGSGKTRVVTSRVAYFCSQRMIAPESIVVLTFNRNAMEELRSRLGTMLPFDVAKRLKIYNFHGYAMSLLQRHGKKVGVHRVQILEPSKCVQLVKQIAADLHKEWETLRSNTCAAGCRPDCPFSDSLPHPAPSNRDSGGGGGGDSPRSEFLYKNLKPSLVKSWISTLKMRDYSRQHGHPLENGEDDEFKLRACRPVLERYQAILQEAGEVDFDDLLLKAAELLKKYPYVVQDVDYMLVDEFQVS